jgi:peroxiredoxin Q/BCP
MAKKKSTKKVAKKKTTKKIAKKSAKKVAKKTTAKKVAKKVAKKTSKKVAAKKSTKKVATKKAVKKTSKKVVKKVSAKKSSPAKKTVNQSKEKFVPHVTSLKPGMIAPYFEGIDQNGNKITSNDLLGRKVVLYFYPKDDTPGCTKEACNLRDNYQRLQDAGYTIIGVSADDQDSHKKFIEKYNLPFSLIADTDKNIIRAFDVWGKKQFMGKVFEGIIRTTFVIDENGIITDVITSVDVENHAQQILKQ